jgi:hypothetical protein
LSFKEKIAKFTMTKLPENRWLLLKERDTRNLNVFQKDLPDEDEYKAVAALLEQLKYDKKNKCYVLKKSDVDEFLEAIPELLKQIKETAENPDEEESSDDDDDDDSSEDDATIQLVLTKNLKHKSNGDIIQDTNVSDSELEESISLSRRLRAVYARLAELERKVALLEKQP